MLFAILFALLSISVGISIFYRINFADNIIAKIIFGLPTGIIVTSFILLALYAMNGYFDNTIFYLTLAITFLISLAMLYPFKFKKLSWYGPKKSKKDKEAFKKVIIWSIIVYAIIAFVLISSLYMKDGTLYCIGPAICSDLMYHIGIGNSLIYTHFPPRYLFTLNTTNIFPFISDFYTATLIKYGLGLRWSVLLPDLTLFLSAVVGVALLTYKVTKNVFISVATLFIFWFGSDYIIGIIIYSLNSITSSIPSVLPPLNIILSENYVTNATGFTAILESTQFIVSSWTSIVYGMLMPQRDFVLGLPIGIMVIYAIYLMGFEKFRFSKLDLIFLGIIIGTLPLVHPVTMEVVVVVGLFAFAYLLLDKKRRIEALKEFVLILIPIICLAVPQLLYMSHQKLAAGWYHFIYQSFLPSTGNALTMVVYGVFNIVIYWLEEIGIPLILAIIGLKMAPKKVRVLFIPFFLLWILITVYAIQPNPADSNKVFVYIFLFISILACYPLLWIYKRKTLLAKVAVIVIIASISLNFAFMYNYWRQPPLPWITNAEFNAINFILHNTSQSSIFAVSNNESLLQVVSSLAHRQTLISIEPYVAMDEHTYPLQQLDSINAQIFEYGNCTAIREYNISYIFYQESNASGEKIFENSNFKLVYNTTDLLRDRVIAIYKVIC